MSNTDYLYTKLIEINKKYESTLVIIYDSENRVIVSANIVP